MGKLTKSIILTFLILVLLVFFHYLGWLRPVENLTFKALGPVQGQVYNFASQLKTLQQNWFSKRNLLKENSDLKENLKLFQLDRVEFNRLQQENDLLKKELGFVSQNQVKYLSARIITGISDPLSQSVIINRGRSDGIVKGLPVVVDKGVLVGKISEVGDGYSKVLLLNDSKSRVAAAIQNSSQTVGLVEGSFGLGFTMTNIPRDQQIKDGDLVVTSGLEGQIPRNLLIAEVDSVNQVESEIFKTAVLKPIIPLNNLSYVLVIIP
ncbi:MAG: rod shape-determining protein MreC [Patescibacteria group bacterium]